jgi:hypothetical protein
MDEDVMKSIEDEIVNENSSVLMKKDEPDT